MKINKAKTINKKDIKKSINNSSRLEGLSYYSAIKNKKALYLLKQYGRAFSVQY